MNGFESRAARGAGLLMMLTLSVSCGFHTPSLVSHIEGEPVALLGLPENRLIRWPSIAVLSDTVFVATNVFPIRGDSLDARPAYLGRLHESSTGDLVAIAPIDLPPGDFQFAYPRIISVGGALHLVWAEFGSPPRTADAWPRSFATSLWHAVLTNGAWSAPERIATSQWFGWSDEVGGVAVDGRGALHIAVWVSDAGSIQRVNDIRLVGGRWDVSRASSADLNQVTTIAAHGDTVVIGLVTRVSDTEHVTLVESTDQGKHWTNGTVVSRRSGASVANLALAATTDGQLLVIGEKRLDTFHLDTIRVVRMRGATRSSTTQVIVPPPTSSALVLAVAPCGSAVILIRTFSLIPQVFELTIPRDSLARLSRPVLSTAAIAAFPGVGASRRSVIAVFAYTASRGTAARSVAMTLPICR